MKKNSLPKPITILILTLLTALVWAGLSIYRTIAVKPPTPVSEDVLKPLTPSLNTEIIQKIESAIFIPDSEIPPMSIGGPVTVIPATPEAPLPSATPEASPSASPEP